jgi:predicted ThiF/HesA family dinucleotide-utilizing enzyme
MLSVASWSEAPALIASLQKDRGALDRRRVACARWWRDYRASLAPMVRDRIRQSFTATV